MATSSLSTRRWALILLVLRPTIGERSTRRCSRVAMRLELSLCSSVNWVAMSLKILDAMYGHWVSQRRWTLGLMGSRRTKGSKKWEFTSDVECSFYVYFRSLVWKPSFLQMLEMPSLNALVHFWYSGWVLSCGIYRSWCATSFCAFTEHGGRSRDTNIMRNNMRPMLKPHWWWLVVWQMTTSLTCSCTWQ